MRYQRASSLVVSMYYGVPLLEVESSSPVVDNGVHIEGKRSTSDQMHQAVSYIKHMQEKIKVLGDKRDRLKKFVEAGVPGEATNTEKEKRMNLLPNTFSISSCNGGVHMFVNSCLVEHGFPLSRVLKEVSDEGYNVISCSCTKAN
ncbi:putative transcription factor bHLH family [Helianthus anomalus]